jgi:hypothetical protein
MKEGVFQASSKAAKTGKIAKALSLGERIRVDP